MSTVLGGRRATEQQCATVDCCSKIVEISMGATVATVYTINKNIYMNSIRARENNPYLQVVIETLLTLLLLLHLLRMEE